MNSDKQIQKAGDNSSQFQIGSATIIMGITEERAQAIVEEQIQYALAKFSEEARIIGQKRNKQFEKRVISRIAQIENGLQSLSDPATQILLRQAQLSVAATDREDDYDLLTELLACHVQKGNERKNRAAIHQAVKIIDDVDNDALCGLTVAHAFWHYFPRAMTCEDSLKILNDMFSKLLYQDLPTGKEWLEHLDILGIVHISSFVPMEMRKIGEYYSLMLSGIICTGLRVGSDDLKKASDLLTESGISTNMLIPNECLDGFYRLSINNEESIDHLRISTGKSIVPLNEKQKQVIKQILRMYSNEPSMKRLAEDRFVQKWNSFETLHKLRLWWEKTPYFVITPVGRILAHTNAKRCDPSIPDLI